MNEAHEKTRIRQLEDAAAHWEHKYANARQYNRNLEERIAALEARCRELDIKPGNWVRLEDHDRAKARIAELEAALRDLLSGAYLTPERHDEISLLTSVETP